MAAVAPDDTTFPTVPGKDINAPVCSCAFPLIGKLLAIIDADENGAIEDDNDELEDDEVVDDGDGDGEGEPTLDCNADCELIPELLVDLVLLKQFIN
jgi:hypothetical protein